MKNNKELVILAGRGSGGKPVTVDSELSQSSTNPVQNQAIYQALATKANIPTATTVSGATPTITPQDGYIYTCGELTSLTISNPPATGKFWIWFTSGATATVVTGIDNFTPNANKVYRIFVENGYATYDSWSVGGGT